MNKNLGRKITSGVLLCSMICYTMPILAFTKDETVYSNLDGKGNVYQTTVSDHLKNMQEDELKDLSDLMNIENVSGEQELDKNGNTLTWKANGEDIYYQGKTDKELPIDCKLTYSLDGEEIAREDIKGKTGKVKVTLEFTNKEVRTVMINGKERTMYVPFVVACGTIINNENAKNIKVTNGKIIDNGNKTIVCGIALPGMQESLEISKEKAEIPTSVIIEMEAKEFDLGEIYIFATPKIIEDKDLEMFDELDRMYEKINILQSSSNEIANGAKTLEGGMNIYYSKSQEFNAGMSQVTSGIQNASKNYVKIDQGIDTLKNNSTTLANGAKSVKEGTSAISNNLRKVNESVEQLEQGGKKLADGENAINNGLNQIINSVSKVSGTDNTNKIKQLQYLVETNKKTINDLKATNTKLEKDRKELLSQKSKLEATIKANVDSSKDKELTAKLNEINTNLIAINTQITSNKTMIPQLEQLLYANNQALSQTIETLKETDLNSMKQLQEGLNSLKNGVGELQIGTAKLNGGLKELNSGTKTLADKSQELAKGSEKLYDGTEKIQSGTNSLAEGSSQMKQGLETLEKGSNTLQDASNSLVEGANTINNGAIALSEGITKFNTEGINKICNMINGDVKEIQTRVEKLQELANEYNNFTMISENTVGSVKFIMMIDSLGKQEKTKEEIILPNNIKEKE